MTTIKITKYEIEHGNRSEFRNCPIAHGITKALPHGYFAEVFESTFDIVTDDTITPVFQFCTLPYTVWQWIKRFDRHGCGSPFEFELEIPELPPL